ncbi:MAG: guanylate kinase [Bacteroidales bacterium]|nr:guanylate kinase [Bacteroidales bacterium]
MQGKLIIFSAPSGSGKTTIVRHLLGRYPQLAFSISATSREPRRNEKEGVDYCFLTLDNFRKKIEEGEFLEWEEVYAGQYYGTLRSEVKRLRKAGMHVLFDIDVVGGIRLKQEFGSDALAIFVQPPSPELMEKRLRARGTDSEEQLQKRLGKAREELAYADKFDHVLVNDRLTDTLLEAEQLIENFIS